MTPGATAQVHASAVAFEDRGILITGASGAGKSTLAIELMAMGAGLVADDRVDLARMEDGVVMSCPPRLVGLIEARGVGLIRVAPIATCRCALIVDLDQQAERLPRTTMRDLLGISCPVIFGKERAGLAAILRVLIHSGGLADPGADVATLAE